MASLPKFLVKKIGEDKDCSYRIKDKELFKSFFDLKNKLGRIPRGNEWSSYGLAVKRYGSYEDFMKKAGINPKEAYKDTDYENRYLTKEDMFKEYQRVKEVYGKSPGLVQFSYKKSRISKFSEKKIRNEFGKFSKFKEQAEKWIRDNENISDNIKIISKYKPKTIAIPIKKEKKGTDKKYEKMRKIAFKSKEDKTEIRNKILSNIKEGDTILILESPNLTALREIERRSLKPKRIVIPNHLEFDKLAEALKTYKTKLNIECVNTSALQYLVDSEEKFDFVWLDYCGAFSYYMKDLDILLSKHFNKMKLVLTYNIFDPSKDEESYYFTRVIDYVLDKVGGKAKVRLLNDITYRYKKNMYNVGFSISKEK